MNLNPATSVAVTVPNRLIRESARTSRTLAQLSDSAERLFWRIVTYADDFGRFDADPEVLRGACTPLVRGYSAKKVVDCIAEMVRTDLVRLYHHGEGLFGYFPGWPRHQRVRTQVPRYPAPPNGDGEFSTIGFQRAIPKALRDAIRARDVVCLCCGASDDLVFDHVKPVIAGGEATAENLQLLCHDCNAAKSTQTLDFRDPGEAERGFAAIRRNPPPVAAECGSYPIRSESVSESKNTSSGPKGASAEPLQIPEEFRQAIMGTDLEPLLTGQALEAWWKRTVTLDREYPWLNVAEEFRAMDRWLVAHPERQKKRLEQFAMNWLAKNLREGLARGLTARKFAKKRDP